LAGALRQQECRSTEGKAEGDTGEGHAFGPQGLHHELHKARLNRGVDRFRVGKVTVYYQHGVR
jgi:hypothetical protein